LNKHSGVFLYQLAILNGLLDFAGGNVGQTVEDINPCAEGIG